MFKSPNLTFLNAICILLSNLEFSRGENLIDNGSCVLGALEVYSTFPFLYLKTTLEYCRQSPGRTFSSLGSYFFSPGIWKFPIRIRKIQSSFQKVPTFTTDRFFDSCGHRHIRSPAWLTSGSSELCPEEEFMRIKKKPPIMAKAAIFTDLIMKFD